MPRLDARLRAVATQIRSDTHADIGSDHGGLLVALLRSGRIHRAIAIENKRQPFANSRAALEGFNAEVRFGDGLSVLAPGQADSLSICGLGGESMAGILESAPDHLPPRVVLQPNRRPELLRQWALTRRFHLVDEQIAWGHWPYSVLTYERASDDDPAYEGIDRQAALLFGPWNIKRWEPRFVARLEEERRYLLGLDALGEESRRRFEAIGRLLGLKSGDRAVRS